jgi:hypothetical protein
MKINDRTKVLLVAVLLAGAGAAAWFLYLEEWLADTPPPPVAKAKPPASVAKAPAPKPAAEAPKPAPAAEAPKPAPAAEAPKPAPVAEAPKPAVIPASAPVVMTQAAPPPKLAPAPKEPAKPMAEAPKPAAETPQPAAEAPKPAAETPKPMAEAPAPPAEPREPPVAVPAPRGPSVPGPKYNDLATAVLYRDAKGVDELLAFGKWPEKADGRGITPLMLAALLGEAGMAESLLKAGANPNRPGPGGSTATSIARERSDTPMLKLLQSHGGR